MLFVFFTQTVLAGIDLHNGSDNANSSDIIEHYIDVHSINAYSTVHQCDSELENKSNNTIVYSDTNNVQHDHQHNKQHSCHGHMTSFSFIEFSIFTFNYSHFSSTFSYLFNNYSAIVSPADRPPITSSMPLT
ncbi:MAG: hypothetical protein KZQ70_07900 [gamma proteobacterium symbiont of Lucinoma myriamae]|nr:hypothetical protein [gamma proteobacterium symbiont of Lucinoma myriamae]MCU7817422.1 hypothetical protein [gamma proteobacterium symbiont of Lucinoma myriamae]MCU7832452.1 hypothetical protein [gamma proteobacterium symbiont of Lucinoma myriamae]